MSEKIENDLGTVLSPAFIAAAEICNSKRNDYGGDIEEYFPYGHKSYAQMIHVKAKRIVNLAKKQVIPCNESTEDSLLDLINYASFYYDWLKGGSK